MEPKREMAKAEEKGRRWPDSANRKRLKLGMKRPGPGKGKGMGNLH